MSFHKCLYDKLPTCSSVAGSYKNTVFGYICFINAKLVQNLGHDGSNIRGIVHIDNTGLAVFAKHSYASLSWTMVQVGKQRPLQRKQYVTDGIKL
jgi:hypothetical protein